MSGSDASPDPIDPTDLIDADADAPAPMDDEVLLSALKSAYEDASSYADDVLAPERAKAFDYWLGEVYGRDNNPENPDDLQNRTTVVMREVADAIGAMLPGLIRVFTSGEEVVRYEPRNEEDVDLAQQQTDYVNYVLDADGNSWFLTLHDAIHDALLKRAGVIKWWWESKVSIEEFRYTGLSVVQAEALRNDPEIEVLEETAEAEEDMPSGPGAPPGAGPAPASPATGPAAPPPGPPQAPPPGPPGPPTPPGAPPAPSAPMGAPAPPGGAQAAPGGPPAAQPPAPAPEPPPVRIDMRVRRSRTGECLRIAAVPPEEFLIARDARSVPTSPYVAHRSVRTVSDAISLGCAKEEAEARASPSFIELGTATGRASGEAEQRNPGLSWGASGATDADKSMWWLLYVEHFIRVDADGDGIAELHRVVTVGEAFDYILSDEVVQEAGFAVGAPVRVPHAVIGLSVADQVMDLQDLKTNVIRATLDSLAQAIFPATAVVESATNMNDVLSTEVGRVIRMQAPGMVQPMSEPFIGPQALGVLAYLDEVRANRTGMTKASAGLDDKVLQSTTKTAVDNTIERAQERTELIARMLAETMVRDVFRGVLRVIVRHQDKPRTVRLRNKWVEVDPRFWNAEADVRVNVGLGKGSAQTQMQFLATIGQKQQEIISATGPGNPLVSPSQMRHTLGEMLRLSGFKDASAFFKPLTPEDDKRIAAAAQKSQEEAKQRDPALVLANAELQKQQSDAEVKREEMRLKFVTGQAEDDRERDKAAMEFVLKAAEIQAKYGAQIDIAAMKAMIDRERSAFQMANEQQMASFEQAIRQQEMQQQGAAQQFQQGEQMLDADRQHGLAQQAAQNTQQLGQQKVQSAENIAQFRARQPRAPGGPGE